MDLARAAVEPKRKIGRAVTLFEEAQTELRAWAERNPGTGRLVGHEDRRRIDIFLNGGEEPPLADMALIVGDAIHNVRSALDNLVWTLAHMHGEPDNPKGIYFPVSEKASGWNKGARELPLPPDVLERIKEFQPFTFDSVHQSFLWNLHHLDIADKHRAYLVAEPLWMGSALNDMMIGLDAGTEVRPVSAAPTLQEWSEQLIGWFEFSIPYWDRGPLTGTVTVDTAFSVSTGSGQPGVELSQMSHFFPHAATVIVDRVCGVI